MVAITTFDNPFDPFDQFVQWYNFDVLHGYNSCSLLDRVAYTSDAFTEEENQEEIERAIDEIIKYDFRHIFKKIVRESNENSETLVHNPV